MSHTEYKYRNNITHADVQSEIDTQGDLGYSLVKLDHDNSYANLIFKIAPIVDQVHFGNIFRAHGLFEDIGNGSSAFIQLKTNGKEIYFTSINIAPSDELITIRFVENPTVTDGTNEITPYNANRTSAKTSTVEMYDNPTGVSDGTEIESIFLPGSSGAGQARSGERYTSPIYWVADSGSDYVFEIQNGGGGNVDVSWDLSWYEI